MRPPPLPTQIEILRNVLDRLSGARRPGQRAPLVAFDLDGVIYDVRPRTLQILMEYANEVRMEHPDLAHALATLDADRVERLLSDTLRNCGVVQADIKRDISRYWHDRFHSEDYLDYDVPVECAVEFVQACYDRGANVVYLAHRDLPGMGVGTVASLMKDGFPFGVPGAELVLKADATLADETFKRDTLPQLDRLGELAAYFGSEPVGCNVAWELFPRARISLLDQGHPHVAPSQLQQDIHLLRDFRLPG